MKEAIQLLSAPDFLRKAWWLASGLYERCSDLVGSDHDIQASPAHCLLVYRSLDLHSAITAVRRYSPAVDTPLSSAEIHFLGLT